MRNTASSYRIRSVRGAEQASPSAVSANYNPGNGFYTTAAAVSTPGILALIPGNGAAFEFNTATNKIGASVSPAPPEIAYKCKVRSSSNRPIRSAAGDEVWAVLVASATPAVWFFTGAFDSTATAYSMSQAFKLIYPERYLVETEPQGASRSDVYDSIDGTSTAPTATTGASISLAEGTNNGNNYVTLKAPDALGSNPVHTLPEVADGEVLVTTGAQTITGQKSLADGVNLSPFLTARTDSTGASLTLAEGTLNGLNTASLKAPDTLDDSRVHTLPDVANGEILVTTGAQTVLGQKTFQAATTLQGGVGAGSIFESAEITGNGGAQATAHGLGREPTIAWAVFTELNGSVADMSNITKDGTNLTITVTTGQKYKLFAI